MRRQFVTFVLVAAALSVSVLAGRLLDNKILYGITTANVHIADSALARDTTALYLRDTTNGSVITVEQGRFYTFDWAFISAGSDSDTVIVELQNRDRLGVLDFIYPWETALTDTGAGAGSDTTGHKYIDADAAWCGREWRVRWIYWDPSDSADWVLDNLDSTTNYFGAKLTVRE